MTFSASLATLPMTVAGFLEGPSSGLLPIGPPPIVPMPIILPPIFAQAGAESLFGEGETNLVVILSLLVVMAMAPFLLSMVTSFAKLVIVGGLLRQGLGTQQVPPASVITGLALILTIHIMSPVMREAYDGYHSLESEPAAADPAEPDEDQARSIQARKLQNGFLSAADALTAFLERHTDRDDEALFERLRFRLSGSEDLAAGASETFRRWIHVMTVLAPAFLLTELTEAFQIGFLLLIPFLIIELVVSNIMLALGMMMMNPQVITLPLKLLLFVLVDGWTLILEGIVTGYTA